MVLWAILAVLTAAVITAVCVPLARPKGEHHVAAESDAEIYKAQLAEIEDERERGVISPGEAEAARVEVSRRLLSSAGEGGAVPQSRLSPKQNHWALGAITSIILAVALGGYLALGSPMLPQQPHTARANQTPEAKRVAELVERVEERLRERPDEGRGWDVIAPVYLRQQRYHDAVFAFQQALRLNGENAERLAGLGEAMVLRNDGRVSDKARLAFSRALERDAASLKAQYWLAVHHEQNDRLGEAADAYEKIMNASPEDAPWRATVGARLATVQQRLDPSGERAPALSPEAMRSAENMTREERAAMIENMVAGLAERLEADGSDLDGWLRLMGAYKALGKSGEARQAAASARENFEDNSDALERIDDAARRLGLQS